MYEQCWRARTVRVGAGSTRVVRLLAFCFSDATFITPQPRRGRRCKEKLTRDREPRFETNLLFVIVEIIRRLVHISLVEEFTLIAATRHRLVDRVGGIIKQIRTPPDGASRLEEYATTQNTQNTQGYHQHSFYLEVPKVNLSLIHI